MHYIREYHPLCVHCKYAEILETLRKSIKENRPSSKTLDLLLHDNAPCHLYPEPTDALIDNGFGEISHPPYSPDQAPSDYHLFPGLEKALKGRSFSSDDEVKSAVSAYFDSKDNDFFSNPIQNLEYRWEQCILLKGEYIEKNK